MNAACTKLNAAVKQRQHTAVGLLYPLSLEEKVRAGHHFVPGNIHLIRSTLQDVTDEFNGGNMKYSEWMVGSH